MVGHRIRVAIEVIEGVAHPQLKAPRGVGRLEGGVAVDADIGVLNQPVRNRRVAGVHRLLHHITRQPPMQHGVVVFPGHALALGRVQRQRQHLGSKSLALVARGVARAVEGSVDAVAQFLDQHPHQVRVAGLGHEPGLVDKHRGAALRPLRRKGCCRLAHRLGGCQQQRHLGPSVKPLLPYGLGLGERIGVWCPITGEQTAEGAGAVLLQKVHHGGARLLVSRKEAAVGQRAVGRRAGRRGTGRPQVGAQGKAFGRVAGCGAGQVPCGRPHVLGALRARHVLGHRLGQSLCGVHSLVLWRRPGLRQGSSHRCGR